MIEQKTEIEKISDTLEKNYLPYAMSVIYSRALVEIDGFKPSHRKLLYTMYKMGLLKGNRTKSANIVGQTMKLNPHGEGAIYSTLVRMSKSNESLLHPYIDSKGNFGKVYSKDMAFAASRYTEAKLDKICEKIFEDIEKGTVEFVPNYDGTMYEPSLLPVQFPSVLVNPNKGIAVGMASNICSFNLVEINEATKALMDDPKCKLNMIKGPDFPTGGQIIKDTKVFREIIETGKGTFRIKSVYKHIKKERRVEITEIPYTTTIEAIIDKIIDLVKRGVIKEISDVRDESDLKGLRITIDFKKGADVEKIMRVLVNETTIKDTFSCNFNILINSYPQVVGVRNILLNWIDFRVGSIRNGLRYDISKAKERLHLLEGLKLVILDIDKAIKIIRNTPKESMVVANLIKGFKIDEIQAEYIANIKLRHINREYLSKQIAEANKLIDSINLMKKTYDSDKLIHDKIKEELDEISKLYGKKRLSKIVVEKEEPVQIEEKIENSIVVLTKGHYVKKLNINQANLIEQQKIKEGDEISSTGEYENGAEILCFTNKFNVYKVSLSDIDQTRSTDLGVYLPSVIGLENSEEVLYSFITNDFKGFMLFAFENGNIAKINLESYKTKNNRSKLVKAYFSGEKIINMEMIREDCDVLMSRYFSQKEYHLLVNTSLISVKTSRNSRGQNVQRMGKNGRLVGFEVVKKSMSSKLEKYRTEKIPAAGVVRKPFS